MYFDDEIYREDLETTYGAIPEVEEIFNKKILVTGATGLIGAFLIDELLWMNDYKNAGIEIYCLGRDYDRIASRFKSHLDRGKLHMAIQDVVEPLGINSNLDYIIHAAGDGYPEAFKVRPVETMTPALIGTYQLLQAGMSRRAKKLLYVSSGEIYGKFIGCEHAFKESDIGLIDSMSVRSCYPMAKKSAETLCVSFSQEYGLETVIARPGHIYGATTTLGDNRATVQFLCNAINNENICMYSKGLQMRSYTYVADCVAALLTILIRGKGSESYNVANSKSCVTIAEFAKILADQAGVKFEIHEPNDEQRKELTPIEYAVLDSTKLERLGWKGRYDIKIGIDHMYRIAKHNKNYDKR